MFISHPGKPLKEHLIEVYEIMKSLHKERREFVNLEIDDEFLKILTISHDFGKYSSYFQKWLKENKKDKNNLHHHSELGAFFGVWLLLNKNYSPKHILACYHAVRGHHSYLKDNYEYDEWKFERWFEDLKRNSKVISEEIGYDICGFLDINVLEKLKRELIKAKREIRKEGKIEAYILTLYVFSLLLEADRRSAGGINNSERKFIPKNAVDEYRRIKFGKSQRKIDELREGLYTEVMKELENLKEIPKILTINAPTGLGKTLLNLAVALNIRERKSKNFLPRIVYSLPFTAIIDQTYEVFNDVLKTVLKDEYTKEPESYLLKHHHLSDIKYRRGEEELPLNEALLFVEGWESEIIITTFVQLLEGIIGVHPEKLRRFNNLAGAIVILDEVQNIRREHWEVVGEVMKALSEYMGITFILSTATKPAIVEGYNLVKNVKRYALKRTRINYLENASDYNSIKEKFLEEIDKGKASYLMVMNTVNSSIRMYKLVKEEVESRGYEIFYLSLNVVPLHRIERIRRIKELLQDGKKVVLISTQVVEAGVDLDFDVVFRDLGPFDSIVQVAGRCNRNALKDIGEVFVFHHKTDGRSDASIIYGVVLKEAGENILKRYSSINEEEFYKLTKEYFEDVRKRGKSDEDILEGVRKLKFENVGKFKVIEEAPIYSDVFVQVDEKALKVWERFVKNVLEEKDFRKRYLEYVAMRKDLRSYIISVPKKYVPTLPDCYGIKYVPLDSLEMFYDRDTGFRRDEEGAEVW